jgi:capsular exopolysaccharide synthesis family protein
MDISAFFGLLRRRAPIIIVAVLVAAAAAYVISDRQERKYTATAKLLLQGKARGEQGTNYASPLPDTATDRESLVTQGAVVRRTEDSLAKRIGRARAQEAAGALSAASGPDSDVVALNATASDPKVAALAANTLAVQNIALRKQQALGRIRRAEASAQRQLSKLDPSSQADGNAINSLQQTLSDARGAAATQDGDASVVTRAAAPSAPSSPKPTRNALIGGFAGLLLGLMLALTREQLDRRVRHSKGLEDVFGLPVLANVPKSKVLGSQNGKALDRLPPREAEAFQILRANLHYLNTDRDVSSVVVTSTGIGDGKSTVSLNLAKADAVVGKKVLLVEADVRRPHMAPTLGLGHSEGLTAFLSDRSMPLADVTNSVPVGTNNGQGAMNTMDVVVAGPVPDNPSGLIDSDRMRDLIRQAEEKYDLVVIDTAPASMVADAIPLMSEASAVVIVSKVGRVTSGEADSLRGQLERINAPAFGLVANFAPTAGGKSGYGYY